MEHRHHTALVGIIIMVISAWFDSVTTTTSSLLDDRSSFQRNVVEDSRWTLDQDILWEQLTHHPSRNENPVNWWESSLWLAMNHWTEAIYIDRFRVNHDLAALLVYGLTTSVEVFRGNACRNPRWKYPASFKVRVCVF